MWRLEKSKVSSLIFAIIFIAALIALLGGEALR
jgi:hypothetical protein